MVSPDYLLRDALAENEVSKIRELAELWESASPRQQEVAVAMIRAVLEIKDVFPLSESDKYHIFRLLTDIQSPTEGYRYLPDHQKVISTPHFGLSGQ